MAHRPRTSAAASSPTAALSGWMNAMLATDEIVAGTAHEFRLPLSHIKGFVTSLRRTDVEWDEATQKQFITEIDLETDRLTEVVEALLATHTADGRNEPDANRGCTHPAAVVQGA